MLLGLIIGMVADRAGQTMRWECQAFEHHAAAWRMDARSGRIRWQWLDDYFLEEAKKARTPKPTSKVNRL